MKKTLVVLVIISMLCVGMTGIANSATQMTITKKENVNENYKTVKNIDIQKQEPDVQTMEIVKNTVDNYLQMDENLYNPDKNDHGPQTTPRPLLGGNEIFGLWINFQYKGTNYSKKISITPSMIRGKLSDPLYRTPIKFDIDDDPQYDIEAGFGFFRYGVEEQLGNGNTVTHSAWATAFDFYQIESCLDDQLAELEVWQEFHVNLGIINNPVGKSLSSSSNQLSGSTKKLKAQSSPLQNILSRISQRLVQTMGDNVFSPLQKIINNCENNRGYQIKSEQDPYPLPAGDDYIVTRVGYRSPEGQKIPMTFQKTFAISKDNIFRPFIFQHEMDPNDIIGTASSDVMFGFQAYKQGYSNPSFDIEFDVNLNPAVYTITQFIPRDGKIFYYYHSVGDSSALDITFSSNLLEGFNSEEEKEGTLSFTISLDAPDAVAGTGKWMMFDPELLGDSSPFGGRFVYTASHKFDVGFKLNSPRFEEKIELRKIPTQAVLSWGADAVIDIEQGEMLEAEVEAFVDLTMNSKLGNIVVYYPKKPGTPDVTFFEIENIPSSREIRSGASLYIENSSMLTVEIGGFVERSKSSSLGDITVYWPKADPENDSDRPMIYVPEGSFANSGRTEVEGKLYYDRDEPWTNLDNYVYGKIERTASSNFGELNFYLPNIDIPLVEVQQVPGDAFARGKLWWNQLRADGRIQRDSSGGGKDPITVNIVFDSLIISDTLRIGNGHIDTDFKIAEDGWFNFDTSNDMLGNSFQIGNLETGNTFDIEVDTIAAEDFQADWDIDTAGGEIEVDELVVSGKVTAFKNFDISVELDGEDVQFDGNWTMGEQGAFVIDFHQDQNVRFDFDLGNSSDAIELNGYVELRQDLHFDMMWKWYQGGGSDDPGYFKINENTNEPNIEEMNFYFTYNDNWGANITLYDVGIYVCVEWFKTGGQWHIYPVFSLWGDLDLHLLLAGTWFYNVEDNWP